MTVELEEDSNSYWYIFVVSLLSFYIYTNHGLATQDDFWLGQFSSFVRDGRIGVLPIYYPLVKIFEMDMHFRYLGYLFLCASVSVYLYDLARGLNLSRANTVSFAAISILLISSINYDLLIYKAAFVSVGCVFLYSWLSMVCFARASSEEGGRRSLWLFGSCFAAACVFVTYQALFLLPFLSIMVLTFFDGERLRLDRESLIGIVKYGAVYSVLVVSFLLLVFSDFYIDLYTEIQRPFSDVQRPRASGFDFSGLLALDGGSYLKFYLIRVLRLVNRSMNLSAVIILSCSFLYVFLFHVKESRDRLNLLLLLSVVGIATVFNPFIVLNDGIDIRRVAQSFFTTFSLFVCLSFFLVEMRKETTKSRVLLLAWLLVVILVSHWAGYSDSEAMFSILFLSLPIFFALLLFGRRNFPLYAVVMVFSIVVNAQFNLMKIDSRIQLDKIEDKIYTDVMYEVLRMKRKYGSARISVFVGPDDDNYRTPFSYSRLGYFESKNVLQGIDFFDGRNKCEGSRAGEFVTIEEVDESSIRVCF